MTRHIPTIVFVTTFFFTSSLFAQADSLSKWWGQEKPFAISRYTHAFLGEEFTNKQSWGLRTYFGYGGDWIQAAPFTVAVTNDKKAQNVKVSANPLVLLPWLGIGATFNPHGGGGPDWLLLTFAIMTLPQLLPNLTITAPIIKDHFYLGLSQRTDYYLFNSPAKVYTEASAVARFYLSHLSAEVRWSYPLTQGFLEDKRPYLGGSIYWVF